MHLVFLGPPGVGKGTQAKLLSDRQKLVKISTGDILREAVRKATPLGIKAKGYMDAGQLVPDEVVVDLIRERMKQSECERGTILDGFPRNIPQAEALEKMMLVDGLGIDKVVNFSVEDDEIVKRLSNRRSCPDCQAVFNIVFQPPKNIGQCDECGSSLIQRSDDEPAIIQKRLAVYQSETAPLIKYYEEKGLLLPVDASGDPSRIFDKITSALKKIS